MYKIKKIATAVALFGALTVTPIIAFADNSAIIAQLQAQIAALSAQIASLSSTSSSVSTGCVFTRPLTIGSQGSDVVCLQNYLASKGHFSFSGGSTGYFGSITRSAVASWQSANEVAPAVGYFGQLSQAKYAALMAASAPTPTPITAVVNSASLSAANLSSTSITKNASNFKLLDVKFAGTGVVNSLAVKRIGFSTNSDFVRIYLYKDGVRLTDSRALNSNNEAIFNNLHLTAPFTLTVMADFNGTVGNIAKVELRGDYPGLPLVSNDFTFSNISSGSVTLTAATFSDQPVIGQRNAQISQFVIKNTTSTTTDGETVTVKHLELWNGGNNIISNVKISDGTNTVSGIVDGSKLIFDVSTSIKSSKTKTFKVYADVDGSDNDTIEIYVRNIYDVIVTGDDFGFGSMVDISAFGSDDVSPLTLISNGTLTFKKTTNIAQAATFGEVKDILGFEIKSEDEAFDITDLKFTVDSTVVEKLQLVSGGIVLATEDADTNTVSFTDLAERVNGTKQVALRATLRTQDDAAVNSASFTPSLVSYMATGVNSDNDTGEVIVNLTGKPLAVYSSIVKITPTVSSGTFTSSLNKKVFGFKVTAVGGDVQIASSTAFVLLNVDTNGASSTYNYELKHGSDVIASGTNADFSSAIVIDSSIDDIEIQEGDTEEFVLFVDTTGFSGDNRFIGVSIDDVNGAIKWIGQDSDGEWLTSPFSSIEDTIVGLPIDPIEFN